MNTPTKRCRDCGNEYPATTDYFYKTAKSMDCCCKQCRAGVAIGPKYKAPEGFRQCSICKHDFPATDEYFPRSKDCTGGIRSQCKTCRRKYELQWHHAHPNKSKIIKDRWVKKNPEKRHATGRRHYYRHREKCIQQTRRWQSSHPEKAREIKRQYTKRHTRENRERVSKWQKANPVKFKENLRIARQRRRARRKCLPHTFTRIHWEACLAYFSDRCAYCGNPCGFWHTLAQDHFIPVTRGGGYTPDNIVPACHGVDGCNNSKGDKPPEEWLIAKFGKRKANAILKRIQDYFEHVKKRSE